MSQICKTALPRAGDAAAMNLSSITLRRARADDQLVIQALVRGERLNPSGLHWARFCVAVADDRVIGAVQMRRHHDGSFELGSLVVARAHRGYGLAARLIDDVLARHTGPVQVVTARGNAAHYERWGFRAIAARRAPRAVRRNWFLGSVFGGTMALLHGRAPRRLVILERAQAAPGAGRDRPPPYRADASRTTA